MKRTPLRRVSKRGSRDKGSRGEKEVVQMFRVAGWPDACRSPGSGSLRPWGAGDMSPWPGDLAYTNPFIVEVKYDEKVYRQGEKVKRTWVGSAFLREKLRDLTKLGARHNGIVGAHPQYPVLFARSNLKPWRVFVDEPTFAKAWGVTFSVDRATWVEITPEEFFEVVVPSVLTGAAPRTRFGDVGSAP